MDQLESDGGAAPDDANPPTADRDGGTDPDSKTEPSEYVALDFEEGSKTTKRLDESLRAPPETKNETGENDNGLKRTATLDFPSPAPVKKRLIASETDPNGSKEMQIVNVGFTSTLVSPSSEQVIPSMHVATIPVSEETQSNLVHTANINTESVGPSRGRWDPAGDSGSNGSNAIAAVDPSDSTTESNILPSEMSEPKLEEGSNSHVICAQVATASEGVPGTNNMNETPTSKGDHGGQGETEDQRIKSESANQLNGNSDVVEKEAVSQAKDESSREGTSTTQGKVNIADNNFLSGEYMTATAVKVSGEEKGETLTRGETSRDARDEELISRAVSPRTRGRARTNPVTPTSQRKRGSTPSPAKKAKATEKRKHARKKPHPDSGKRYGVGKAGTLCDVCFLEEDKEVMKTPLIICIKCGLIVHTACYPPTSIVDPQGRFLCDPCTIQFYPNINRNHRSKKPDTNNTPSPDPLANEIEAKDDGRLYSATGRKNLDIYCQLCARRDVLGGMKPTDTKGWVHLACLMSTDAYLGDHTVTHVDTILKKNKTELNKLKKESEQKPRCEACDGEAGMLLRCKHLSAAGTPCDMFIHALCAEITDRARVVTTTRGRDILSYKCALHSYEGLDACGICRLGNKQSEMLECTKCNQGFHMSCLEPPLSTIPDGDWYCPACLKPPLGDEPPKQQVDNVTFPPIALSGTVSIAAETKLLLGDCESSDDVTTENCPTKNGDVAAVPAAASNHREDQVGPPTDRVDTAASPPIALSSTGSITAETTLPLGDGECKGHVATENTATKHGDVTVAPPAAQDQVKVGPGMNRDQREDKSPPAIDVSEANHVKSDSTDHLRDTPAANTQATTEFDTLEPSQMYEVKPEVNSSHQHGTPVASGSLAPAESDIYVSKPPEGDCDAHGKQLDNLDPKPGNASDLYTLSTATAMASAVELAEDVTEDERLSKLGNNEYIPLREEGKSEPGHTQNNNAATAKLAINSDAEISGIPHGDSAAESSQQHREEPTTDIPGVMHPPAPREEQDHTDIPKTNTANDARLPASTHPSQSQPEEQPSERDPLPNAQAPSVIDNLDS